MGSPNEKKQPTQKHTIRTLFAALFGSVAILLLLFSVVTVWLNRTVTDTNTFVATVGPVASKPEVQELVADKLSTAFLENDELDIKQAAKEFLTKSERTGKDTEQLRDALRTFFEGQILIVVQSDRFNELWKQTLQTTHGSFLSQLNSGSDNIRLNLRPTFDGVVDQLNETKLKPLTKEIKLENDAGIVTIEASQVSNIHTYYSAFQAGTWAIVATAFLSAMAAIVLSVHHAKTLRRIMLIVGVILVFEGLLLSIPQVISASGPEQAAAFVISSSIFRNLQVMCLGIGGVLIVGAIAYKLYERQTLRSQSTPPKKSTSQ